jgi:hypothetical protein
MPCRPGLRKSPQEEKDICCFVCNPCPENEISNMTSKVIIYENNHIDFFLPYLT